MINKVMLVPEGEKSSEIYIERKDDDILIIHQTADRYADVVYLGIDRLDYIIAILTELNNMG